MKKDAGDQNPEENPEVYTLSEKLFEALTAWYIPAESPKDADETKSTQDLIEEMETMQEVSPWEVNKLMEGAGFKIHYTGSGYEWMLKLRSLNQD